MIFFMNCLNIYSLQAISIDNFSPPFSNPFSSLIKKIYRVANQCFIAISCQILLSAQLLANFIDSLFVPKPFLVGQPIGLINEGNICFINSFFQMIMNSPAIEKLLVNDYKTQLEQYTIYRDFLEKILNKNREANYSETTDNLAQDLFAPEEIKTVLMVWAQMQCEHSINPKLRALIKKSLYIELNWSKAISALNNKQYDFSPKFSNEEWTAITQELNKMMNLEEAAEVLNYQNTLIRSEIEGLEAFLKNVKLYHEAEERFRRTLEGSGSYFTKTYLSPLRRLHKPFDFGYNSQEDVAEFAGHLLFRIKGSSFHEEIFGEKITQKKLEQYKATDPADRASKDLKYKELKDKANRENASESDALTDVPLDKIRAETERMTILQVELTSAEKNMQDLLNRYTQFSDESLGQELACYAQGFFYTAKAKYIFQPSPSCLFIQAKRFSSDLQKNSDDFLFSENIQLEQEIENNQKTNQSYRLKSIVYHIGSSIQGGHYIAYVYKNKQWWLANDDSIQKASKSSIKNALRQGYLYLYEKEETLILSEENSSNE